VHFVSYRTWLEGQSLCGELKCDYLRYINHYLAYLTLADNNYRQALTNTSKRTEATRAYRRYLRRTMRLDRSRILGIEQALDHFYGYLGLQVSRTGVGRLTHLSDEVITAGSQSRSWVLARPNRK
jgi:hypothetical protein